MPHIESVIRSINRGLIPQFEEKLRAYLAQQDKEWLIEQIIRLSLDAHSLEEMDRKTLQELKARKRAERAERVRELALDEPKLVAFLEMYKGHDRETLVREGFLIEPLPEGGSDVIPPGCRSEKGEALLTTAKDTLFALLFGDQETNTSFQRVQQELLTMTLPVFKVDALDFMKATTELSAQGTWQDPESVSNDMRADNVLLQVEYGEVESENIGHGIVRTLALINHLEINEQILYARMENIEQSTLVE
jgi:hypothetical protein